VVLKSRHRIRTSDLTPSPREIQARCFAGMLEYFSLFCAAFVAATGVDCLAVAIGTAHGLYKFTPKLNIERLKEINAAVDVPLVLHGGSGTPDDMVREAVRNGIRKVNICTEFVKAFGEEYIKTQNLPGFKYSIPGLFAPSKQAGYALARAKMELFALNNNLSPL